MEALKGIRVLDLTVAAPGAFCTMLLGDFGAEVIKVEAPATAGVEIRGSAKSPAAEDGRRDASFYAPNRGKKSVAIDLRSKGGREVFSRLAKTADVLLEGFRPGVVKRLGIGYEEMARMNPRMVYCSLSGYGQTGPYVDVVGHDINYGAVSGLLSLTGGRSGLAAIPRNSVADITGGSLMSALGILVALMARERTGKGQYIDASITDGAASLLTFAAASYFRSGASPPSGTTVLEGGYPYYGVYRAADGAHIAIGCIEKKFWASLCKAVAREDWVDDCFDDRHFIEPATGTRWAEIRLGLEDVFRSRGAAEWVRVLVDAGVPASKVNSLEDLPVDPQLRHREMVVTRRHPGGWDVKQMGVAPKLSDTPGEPHGFSPVLGEHTDEVLGELGYGSMEIAKLREAGAIG